MTSARKQPAQRSKNGHIRQYQDDDIIFGLMKRITYNFGMIIS